MAQITVGLDFGTHQSKVCVETINGPEINYNFFKFRDSTGKEHYTLPSVIYVDDSERLSYGYKITRTQETKKKNKYISAFSDLASLLTNSPKSSDKEHETQYILRYFKQATFTSVKNGMEHSEAMLFTTWYLAYIVFELQEVYGIDFAIQMGVPTDGERYENQKKLAVQLMLSAYNLVENIFNNDREAFLNSTISELRAKTVILPYDEEEKFNYGILVFPEAYACLMPLVSSSKISSGMSLMIDIGGGTTDISFFTIKNNKPQVYAFYSVDKGLNYLTDAENLDSMRPDSNVHHQSEIHKSRISDLEKEITDIHNSLIKRLVTELTRQTSKDPSELYRVLKVRPLIYSGGGSTFNTLRLSYGGFKEIIHVSNKQWRTEAMREAKVIQELGLCPVLSTAYGLSIHQKNDDIKCEPFRDIFANLRNAEREEREERMRRLNSEERQSRFSYADDYSAWK